MEGVDRHQAAIRIQTAVRGHFLRAHRAAAIICFGRRGWLLFLASTNPVWGIEAQPAHEHPQLQSDDFDYDWT